VRAVGRSRGARADGPAARAAGAGIQARHRRRPARRAGDHQRQDAHLPRAGVSMHRLPAGGDRHAGPHPAGCVTPDERTRLPVDQLVCRRPAAACIRDDFAAARCFAYSSLHVAGRHADCRHPGGRIRDAPAAPLPVRGTHAAAESLAHSVVAAPGDRPAERALGCGNAHQHSDHHADRHPAGDSGFSPGPAGFATILDHCARHARHRARVHVAVIHDDDHPLQGSAPGSGLSVDGKRPVLRGHRGNLRHAHGRGAGNRARCARGHPHPRCVHVPDSRAVRQPGHRTPRKAQGRLKIDILVFVFGIPLVGSAILALVGHRESAPDVNVAFSLGTFIAACVLTVEVISFGPLFAWDRAFFIDPLNVFIVTLTAFVGLSTALFSRPYMRVERDQGKMTPPRLRLYHSMYQLFSFTMLLALTTNNMGILWVAMEAATLTTVLLVSVYRTAASLEAAWKYFILCGVGIAQALFGTVLLYMAAEKVVGPEGGALIWTNLDAVKAQLDPTIITLAFAFLFIGYGTKVGLVPLHNWLPDAHAE